MADQGIPPPPPPGFQLEGQTSAPPAGFQIAPQTPDDDVITAAMQHQASLPPAQRAASMAALPQSVRDGITARIRADAQAASTPEARAQRFQQLQAQNVAGSDDLAIGVPGVPALQFHVPVPAAVSNFASAAGKSVYDTARGIGQLVGVESPQDIAQAGAQDKALMDTGAGKFGDLVGQGLQMALPVGDALKGVSGVGKAAEFAGRATPYVEAALKGGAFAGAQPVQEGGSRIANAALGAGAGAAAQGISPVLKYLGMKAAPNVSAAKQAGIDLADKYGIPLHLSQVTDSKPLQTIASAAKYLPFAGNRAAQQAQQGAFNRALSNQIGQDSTSLSDDVLGKAAQQISNGYDDLFARNNVKFGPQSVSKLGALWQQADKDLPPDQAQIVKNQITKYFDAAQANGGTIPGRLYQNVRAGVQNVEGSNQPAAHMVGQVRKIMQQAADDSFAGNDAAALKKLNGQYNSLQILKGAINKRAAGAGGDVAPANLWSLVNGKYGSTPAMRDLGKLGQTVLKDPIPDSGTAARNLVYGGLGVGGFAAPHTVLPAVGAGMTLGRALNSPMVARQLPYLGQNALGALARGSQALTYVAPAIAYDIGGR